MNNYERKTGLAVVMMAAWLGIGMGEEPKKELPVTIHFQSNWNTDTDGKQQMFEKGTCTVNITGKLMPAEDSENFFTQYFPAGVTASYTYHEDIIARPTDKKDSCRGIVGTISGSGTVSLGREFEPGKAAMFIQAFTGPLAAGGLMQAQGDSRVADPAFLKKLMDQTTSQGLYTFNVLVPMELQVKEKPGCETVHSNRVEIPLDLLGLCELGRMGMTGNHSWKTRDKANTGAMVKAVGSQVEYGPETGKKNEGSAVLNWGFGEVEPAVAIYLIEEQGRLEITDDQAGVLAGRRVRLEAVVFPYVDEGTAGEWTLPSTVISAMEGYDRDMSFGRIKPLDDGQKRKSTVDLFCLDGSAGGKKSKISYTAVVRGKKVEGKAELLVFSPTADLEVLPQPTVSIGPIKAQGGCKAYLGKVGGGLSLPGIEIKAKVKFPAQFAGFDKGHELAYVQLMKETILEQKKADYYLSKVEEFSLDTEFPYARLKGKGSLSMNDTPNDEISLLTGNIHHFQAFRTTLLVRPGSGEDAVWLPLETVSWQWAFSLQRVKDNPGWNETCDPANFSISGVRIRLPDSRQKFSGRPEDVPKWDKVIDEHFVATNFRDDQQWRQELEKFRKRKERD